MKIWKTSRLWFQNSIMALVKTHCTIWSQLIWPKFTRKGRFEIRRLQNILMLSLLTRMIRQFWFLYQSSSSTDLLKTWTIVRVLKNTLTETKVHIENISAIHHSNRASIPFHERVSKWCKCANFYSTSHIKTTLTSKSLDIDIWRASRELVRQNAMKSIPCLVTCKLRSVQIICIHTKLWSLVSVRLNIVLIV